MTTVPAEEVALVERHFEALSRGDVEAAIAEASEDVIYDVRNSHAPWSGIYRGGEESRAAYRQMVEAWEELQWLPHEIEPAPGRRLVCESHLRGRGRGSGIEVDATGGFLLTVRGGLLREAVLFQSLDEARLAARRRAFAEARLYFVCEARPRGEDPAPLLQAALAGGVDVIQLRDKDLSGDELVEAAAPFRAAASERRVLFILNDRPDLVAAARADGVHVGQDDQPVAEARQAAGPAAVVGLSTHSRDQIDAAAAAGGPGRADQISVGPVWETPTKQGRAATGLGLVAHAAKAAGELPWFAIGGIGASNVAEVVGAGARRAVVVRAIRDATEPEASARALRAALAAAD